MGNKQSSESLSTIKHIGAQQFFTKIVSSYEKIETTKKKQKTKKDDLLEVCVEWINSHYSTSNTFSLCVSERVIDDKLMEIFCEYLANENNLSSLAIINCNLSKNAIQQLSDAIKVNKSLKTLNLSYNDIGGNGYLVLVEGIKSNNSINELFLENTNSGDNGVIILSQGISESKSLRKISLKYNDITDLGIAALSLSLKDNQYITDIIIEECNLVNTAELDNILKLNKTVSYSIQHIIEQAFKIINKKKLEKRKADRCNSQPLLDLKKKEPEPISSARTSSEAEVVVVRGRARGGTIDMSMIPNALRSNATYQIEDYGNSESKRFLVGSAHTIGRRPEMQDTMLLQGSYGGHENQDLFCVFDGHGSQLSAIYAAKNISKIFQHHLDSGISITDSLRETFLQLDREISEFATNHGTTAVVAFFKDNILYVANVGDSRAVLCRNGKHLRLTVDHKPSLEGETERINDLGGQIINGRVMGALAITRAFGDGFAGKYVSAEPYITVTELNKNDDFLLMACDGLFDIFVDEIAIEIAKNCKDPKLASERLKDQAYISGSTDNISVSVIRFNGHFSSIEPEPDHEMKVIQGLYIPVKKEIKIIENEIPKDEEKIIVEEVINDNEADENISFEPSQSDAFESNKSETLHDVDHTVEDENEPNANIQQEPDRNEISIELPKELNDEKSKKDKEEFKEKEKKKKEEKSDSNDPTNSTEEKNKSKKSQESSSEIKKENRDDNSDNNNNDKSTNTLKDSKEKRKKKKDIPSENNSNNSEVLKKKKKEKEDRVDDKKSDKKKKDKVLSSDPDDSSKNDPEKKKKKKRSRSTLLTAN